MTLLTCKSVPNKVPWNNSAQLAFEKLKAALISAPVLALPDFTQQFELEVDASGFALGAMLLQNDRLVACESRQLNPAEINYIAGERELLAVKYGLEKFRHYLLGSEFVVWTDHRPNVSIFSQADISSWTGRKARWIEYFQQYNFEIK